MKKLATILLPLAALFFGSQAMAVGATNAAPAATLSQAGSANLKIGVVDVQAVLQQSHQMAVANDKLKKQFAPQEKKIVEAQKQLKSDTDQYRTGSSSMKKPQLEAMQKKIQAEQQNLQTMFASFREDLITAHNQSMQKVIKQVNESIQQIAQEQHYDVVLQKQGVLYAGNQFDITKQVAAKLKTEN